MLLWGEKVRKKMHVLYRNNINLVEDPKYYDEMLHERSLEEERQE